MTCAVCGVGNEEYVLVESTLFSPKDWICMFCFEWAFRISRPVRSPRRISSRGQRLPKSSKDWLDRGYVPEGAENLG